MPHIVQPIPRPWDPKGEYAHCFLGATDYWALELSARQHTLGALILFSRQDDSVRLMSQLPDEALLDMRRVMKFAESVLRNDSCFRPDHFNYLQLGNATPRLHHHCVPRYFEPREAFQRVWRDATPNSLPVWKKQEDSIPRPVVERIMVHLAPAFSGLK